ncbi:MarR family transcriptional regulator [Pseudanabaena sp. UWO311]|uniref:MarR family winged helix-turn-helix transcriptional regulator n=2 Tax=Pseudanabaena TaxID=1152 RepID=UPI000CD8EBE8|nr:MarR family transcriptional regulator [Pseudanabaena sp. UWO311]
MDSSLNSISPQLCAARVMDVVPTVMRWIYTEVRQQESTCLTIPQLRALAFLQINAGTSLVALAEYLGVTSASTSTMVERLVQKEYVTRVEHPKSRRKVVLSLTVAGEEHLQQVRQITRDRLADKIAHLPPEHLAHLLNGLEELSQIFVFRDCADD